MHWMQRERRELGSERMNTPRAPARKASVTRSRSQSSSNRTARVDSLVCCRLRKTEYPANGPSLSAALTRATSGRRSAISFVVSVEVNAVGRNTSRRGLRLLLSESAINCAVILELSATRTRIDFPSAIAGPCTLFLFLRGEYLNLGWPQLAGERR